MTNQQINYRKYGIYLVRKYFKEKIKEGNTQNNKLNPFLSINLFELLYTIITHNENNVIDYKNIYEVFWIYVNLTTLVFNDITPNTDGLSDNEKYSYYKFILTNEYINLYNYLIEGFPNHPQEIITILYQLLYNLVNGELRQNRELFKQAGTLKKTSLLLKKEGLPICVIREIFHFLSPFTKDYNSMQVSEAITYFNIFQSSLTLTLLSDQEITTYCIVGLQTLSNINSVSFLLNFVTTTCVDNLIALLQGEEENEFNKELLIYIMQIITNLTMTQNEIIFDKLKKVNIIKVLGKAVNYINQCYNVLQLKKEFVLSLGNLALYSVELAVEIFNNEALFTFLNKMTEEGDFSTRKNTFSALYYIIDHGEVQFYEKGGMFIVPLLIKHLKFEENVDLLGTLVNTLISFLHIENEVIKKTEGQPKIKQFLINQGVVDLFNSKEVFVNGLEGNVQRIMEILSN